MKGAEGHRCNSIIRGLLYSKYIRVASYFSVGQLFQDGASPQFFALSFRAWLDSRFAGRLTGRRGRTEWPRGGPDLTPCDLCLCCWVKGEGPLNEMKNP